MAADSCGSSCGKRLSLSRKRKCMNKSNSKYRKIILNEDSLNSQSNDAAIKVRMEMGGGQDEEGCCAVETESVNYPILPSLSVTSPLTQSNKAQPHSILSPPCIHSPLTNSSQSQPSLNHKRKIESESSIDNRVPVSLVKSSYFSTDSSFPKLLLHNDKELQKKPLIQATLDSFGFKKSASNSSLPLQGNQQINKEHPLNGLKKHPLNYTPSYNNTLMLDTQQRPCSKGKYKPNWSRGRSSCPQYKWIPGTSFTVDAFCYGIIPNCFGYFLTHFHSDHYMGLNKHFTGNLYCSKATRNLVCSQLRVPPSHVSHLPLNEPVHVNGVDVILFEANHCPGSVMFLFILPNNKRILHTGDFRAIPSMNCLQALKVSPIDALFLDTTYCDSRYSFPPQDIVIQFVVDTTLKFLSLNPNALIVCGTYTIGKEKIFRAIGETLGCKVFVSREKMKIIQCLESKELTDICTCTDIASRVHVMSMSKLNPQDLRQYLESVGRKFNCILAFKPTGWTHRSKLLSLSNIKPQQHDRISIYGVPYSEHSSYCELKEFVQCLKPRTIISTVGGQSVRSKAQSLCKEWLKAPTGEGGRQRQIQTSLDTLFRIQ